MDSWKYEPATVGERIRRRRKELNMTQAELAERINRSIKYCADIERGYCGMSIDTLLSFCQALRISPSTLLLGETAPFAEGDDSSAEILAALSECTQEQRQNILQTIRLFTQRR